MPFADHSFDLIVLFEAIYYLPSPSTFLMECRRLLRPGGELVISTINREWSDFNPSPLSRRYFSARELAGLLEEASFQSDLVGAFPTAAPSLGGKIISTLKRVAVKAGWIPKTMKGKELLKRIFLGPLRPLPAELFFEGEGERDTVPIPPRVPCAIPKSFTLSPVRDNDEAIRSGRPEEVSWLWQEILGFFAFAAGFFPCLSIALANVALAGFALTALAFLSPEVPPPHIFSTPFDAPLLCFLTVWLLSALFGQNPADSLKSLPAKFYPLIFFALVWFFDGRFAGRAFRGICGERGSR